MPVRPGRNLAVLVEVATLNQRLKFRGQFTAKDFQQEADRDDGQRRRNRRPE